MSNESLPGWFHAALDILARQRATGEPLASVVNAICRTRRFGPRERKQIGDTVFAYARNQHTIDTQIAEQQSTRGGIAPSRRDQDQHALQLALELPPLQKEGGGGFPPWFTDALHRDYGNQADALAQALNQRAFPILAIDRRLTTQAEVLATLTNVGIDAEPSPLAPNAIRLKSHHVALSKLPKPLQDAVWLMDEASQIAAATVQAKPGERVLDYCAGGGGKTRYLLQTGAQIDAMDIDAKRIAQSLKRDGLKEARHIVADGLHPPFPSGTFDWILLDAPCSGTGTLRRAPDLLSRLKPEDIPQYAERQKELLAAAEKLLKPSGTLVYATCSVLRAENQDVVADVGKMGMRVVSQMQLLPSIEGCDGFFVAVIRKI